MLLQVEHSKTSRGLVWSPVEGTLCDDNFFFLAHPTPPPLPYQLHVSTLVVHVKSHMVIMRLSVCQVKQIVPCTSVSGAKAKVVDSSAVLEVFFVLPPHDFVWCLSQSFSDAVPSLLHGIQIGRNVGVAVRTQIL